MELVKIACSSGQEPPVACSYEYGNETLRSIKGVFYSLHVYKPVNMDTLVGWLVLIYLLMPIIQEVMSVGHVSSQIK